MTCSISPRTNWGSARHDQGDRAQIETILAAYEMDEILYELRDISRDSTPAAGLTFSCIKKFRKQPGFVFPIVREVTMTVPFMRAYTELLVKPVTPRGRHAMGGMAAYIPAAKTQVNEVALAKVREDKLRESADGFDGRGWRIGSGTSRQTGVRTGCWGRGHIKRSDCAKMSASAPLNAGFPRAELDDHRDRVAPQYQCRPAIHRSLVRGNGAVAIYN